MKQDMRSQFTGRHMAAILVAFFGVVIAINLVMATFASRTFGGMIVENSYVASQKFNGWLEKARAEKALGWSLAVKRGARDRLEASLGAGARPIDGAEMAAVAHHPLGRMPERSLRFRNIGAGRYESVSPLPAGRWIVRVSVRVEGRSLHQIVDLQ